MLRDQPLSTFLFGFFTIALPCGQTIVVYSACALSGDLCAGAINGLAFALLTSPSLFLAMSANQLFFRWKQHHRTILGWSAMLVGCLSLCRAMAEWDAIPHAAIPVPFLENSHIVLY